jgi:broad specificity phosphatase PhoE
MPQTLYLARHATPNRLNPGFIYHQLPGPPLTEQGLLEAHGLGLYQRSGRARRIYASPFERCRRTAEIAAQAEGILWQIEQPLGEVQPGKTPEATLGRLAPFLGLVSHTHILKGAGRAVDTVAKSCLHLEGHVKKRLKSPLR